MTPCHFLTIPFTSSPEFAEAQAHFGTDMGESLQSVAERAVREHHDRMIALYHQSKELEAKRNG